MVGRAGRTKECKEGFSILYLESVDQLPLVQNLKGEHICRSQIMAPDYLNNTTNQLLMLAYQRNLDFRQTLSNTLYFIQNKSLELKEFQENITFL